MKIAWHGHSCFEIREDIIVVTDPHDGKSIGIKPPMAKADICLITHDHFDHNCSRILHGDPQVVREPGEHIVKGVPIKGVPTFHDSEGGSKRGRNIVFRFEMNDIVFAHCGDLGHDVDDEFLKEIGPIDILFVPVGGVFTIDAPAAHRLIGRVRPKVAIPMHYHYGGLSVTISSVELFLEGISEDLILRVGNEIEFGMEELPTELEYWVFSP